MSSSKTVSTAETLVGTRLMHVLVLLSCVLYYRCRESESVPNHQVFEHIQASKAGIKFSNDLPYTESLNPYTYKSYYNGGGVAIGDLDGDGLNDLLLTGNLVDNGVYRNLGGFRFGAFPKTTGLEGRDAWTAGVTMADVDGDGLLDVYLCKSGPPQGANRRNELRINNGDGTWSDVAAAAGVDDYGLSVHAAFVDYDRDGDLDLYLLNNSIRSVGGYDIRPGQREVRDTLGGNKLYKNLLAETGELRFVDVSAEAGIYGSDIGFGLGVTVGDVNGDLWPDLYVSNDFFERDYLYVNRGDGSFAERLMELIPETSMGAMGADMADLNGDGAPEIFVTEMLPGDHRRVRTKAQFESVEKQRLAVDKGYHRQFSRNTLLLNRDGGNFSDVARQVGVEATDWSWGALMFDVDSDGDRDLYVANGIGRDLLDQDYIKFLADDRNVRRWIAEGGEVVKRLIDSMPNELLPNRAFRNDTDGALAFVDVTDEWGLGVPSVSNGSAYGDLDNDGDLDLVVNTTDASPLIYRNRSRQLGRHALTIELRDTISAANRAAWGSRVSVWRGGIRQVAEVAPVRGFMSTVDARVILGFGDSPLPVDSALVEWGSGGTRRLGRLALDTTYVIERLKREAPGPALPVDPGHAGSAWQSMPHAHAENKHNDFSRYPLLTEMFSAEGPALAVEVESRLVYLGAAKGGRSGLYRIGSDGRTEEVAVADFPSAERADVVAAVWTDADGDGDADLVVAYGGGETRAAQLATRPVFYRRTGPTSLEADPRRLPSITGVAAGALCAGDFDGDGDEDLFYGTHFPLSAFAAPAASHLLLNDGTEYQSLGGTLLDSLSRVRAASAGDVDGDGRLELIVAQDYGPVRVLSLRGDTLLQIARSEAGLWRGVWCFDADGDGRDEILAGNHGLNSRLRASPHDPLRLRIGDFDGNGSNDYVPTATSNGRERILAQLGDLWQQMPALRRKVPRYRDYGEGLVATVIDTQRARLTLTASELRNGSLRFDGADALVFDPFPFEGQMTTLRAAVGLPPKPDTPPQFFLAGNYTYVKPEFGGQSSGYGVVLYYDSRAAAWRTADHPLPSLAGEVRGLARIGDVLVAARNDEAAVLLELRESAQ